MVRSLMSGRPAFWLGEKACWQGRPGHGMEPPVPEGVAQLHQGIVIVAVAITHHRHRQGTVALDRGHILDQQVGHPAGVHRGAEDHQVPGAEGLGGLAGLGQGEVEGLQGPAGVAGQLLGDLGDHGFGGVGGAEIGRPHGVDLHLGRSPFQKNDAGMGYLHYKAFPKKVNMGTKKGREEITRRPVLIFPREFHII